MVSPARQHTRLLRHSVSIEDYESFPRSTHDSIFPNEKESWSSPPENRSKLRVACFSFLIMGLHNASFGSLLPLLQLHYRNAIYFGDFRILAIFLFPLAGLSASGILSLWLHRSLGIYGVLLLGSAFLTLSYFILAFQPIYIVLFLAYSLSGFGYGLLNICVSTWIGSFKDALYSLTILHTCYYIGGIVSSILIYGLHVWGYSWESFYRMMTLVSLALVGLVYLIFKDETALAYAFRIGTDNGSAHTKEKVREVLKSKPASAIQLSLFIITGLQVAGSSWMPMYIYSYPTRLFSPGKLSLILECTYWLGLSVGSYTLFQVSDRLKSVFKSSTVYICLSICFSISFLVVSHTRSFLILMPIFLLGFFSGPLPASFIAKTSTTLPEHLHVVGLSIIVSAAQTGLSTLPFIVGFLPCMLGYTIMLPAYIFFLSVLLLIWYFLT